MNKTFALATLLAGLAAAGCTSMTPDKKYQADQPPPIQKGGAVGQTELAPVKLPIAKSGVYSDNIDDTNYKEQARRLGSELKYEDKAMTQAKTGDR
ncbi:MAG TPA: hypothetical protein VHR66_13390 [Gemmataceae bacterium]|jgi:hypothetical protein|nr:hypothetical protein [Gemmataceae bacterium]